MNDRVKALLVEVLLLEVVDQWKDHVGTHYPSCYLSHPHCLAARVLDLLEEP